MQQFCGSTHRAAATRQQHLQGSNILALGLNGAGTAAQECSGSVLLLCPTVGLASTFKRAFFGPSYAILTCKRSCHVRPD